MLDANPLVTYLYTTKSKTLVLFILGKSEAAPGNPLEPLAGLQGGRGRRHRGRELITHRLKQTANLK